jgi:hypothetical protein
MKFTRISPPDLKWAELGHPAWVLHVDAVLAAGGVIQKPNMKIQMLISGSFPIGQACQRTLLQKS